MWKKTINCEATIFRTAVLFHNNKIIKKNMLSFSQNQIFRMQLSTLPS